MADQIASIDLAGSAWIMDLNHPDEAVLDGEDGRIAVERTDVDEVAVHFTLPGDDNATVSLYINRLGAFALAGLIQMEASSE